MNQNTGQNDLPGDSQDPHAPQSPADADAHLQAALAAIGSWADLDWEELSTELDRIRHESPPKPPTNLDWLFDEDASDTQ